jgi:hypothetical protein
VDSNRRERIEEKSAANASLNGKYSATNRAEFFQIFRDWGVVGFKGSDIDALTQRPRPVREKTTALAVL